MGIYLSACVFPWICPSLSVVRADWLTVKTKNLHEWFSNQKLQIIYLENVICLFVELAKLLENGFPMKLVIYQQSKCPEDATRECQQASCFAQLVKAG